MFGPGSRELFERLPALHELAPADARRMLSAAFLDIQALSLQCRRSEGPTDASLLDYLRRLASALESHAIFDCSEPDETSRAAAFVAAESLALLAERHRLSNPQAKEPDSQYRFADPALFTSMEAALLYLYAGFDANAGTIATRLAGATQSGTPEAQYADWAFEALIHLARLDPRTIRPPPDTVPASLYKETPRSALRAQLFWELGAASNHYLGWLAARGNVSPDDVVGRLHRIGARLRGTTAAGPVDTFLLPGLHSVATEHADIHHLTRLLAATIASTKDRALRSVPPPADHEAAYSDYLHQRAMGTTEAPRPLIWPNAVRFVSECLPGPWKHSVVSFPTGAGKSFLAELAASQAVLEGWVLYLVPTNALANQVATDLKAALRPLPDISVRLFFGGQEYTTAEGDRVRHAQPGTVAVMTPEKCALALRLSPEVFNTCRLCIFDECHLIAEPGRGALAELVLSHLLCLASNCSVMLMSAMMANPEVLSDWLKSATGGEVALIDEPWRPTRTLRATVAIDLPRTHASQREAMAGGREKEALRKKPLKRPKRYPFRCFHVAVAGLQGAWTSDSAAEYALMQLPTSLEGKTEIDGTSDLAESWVNSTAGSLAAHFSRLDQQVLTFLAASKHHCFTVARQVAPVTQETARPVLSDHARALLAVAQAELGCESEPGTLIERGVAVHTSALLDSERRASEIAFREGSARAMFATGTLAQGLNLPAPIVVIGGTTIGGKGPKPSDDMSAERAKAQLLNAVGRAGRAGVANHGLALVIPDSPIAVEAATDAAKVRRAVAFLSDEDASSTLDSRLSSLAVLAADASATLTTATSDELVAISYLAARRDGAANAETILSKSFAASRWPGSNRISMVKGAASALEGLERVFIARSGAPSWLPAACAKSGLPFFLMLHLQQALAQCPDVLALPHVGVPISRWMTALFDVLHRVSPLHVVDLLGEKHSSDAIRYLWEVEPPSDALAWSPSDEWSLAWKALQEATDVYMAGKPLAEVARILDGTPLSPDPGRSNPSGPIPRAIALTHSTVERLARAAGGLLALLDAQREAESAQAPATAQANEAASTLALLPLAIRTGCNSPSTLAWYRFGIHLRRPAHLLSELFPLPPEQSGDSLAEEWIKAQRTVWLSQDADSRLARTPEELTLLEAARAILKG